MKEFRYIMDYCALFVDGVRKTGWHKTEEEAQHEFDYPVTEYIVT